MVTQPDRRNVPSQQWVLLSYRIPREPSTPRISVWRKLKNLGVVQVGDGLVALPADARTKERLEWVAAQVIEAQGDAIVWIADPSQRKQSSALARQMNDARNSEYVELLTEIEAEKATANETPTNSRTLQRLRRQWRSIDRRDYFRASERDRARLAIAELAPTTDRTKATQSPAQEQSNKATK